MKSSVYGAILGLLWGVYLMATTFLPRGTFSNVSIGMWTAYAVAALFVCASIVWAFRWFTR